MKKLLTHSILVLCLFLSAISAQAQTYWNGTVDKEFAGTGTEADPYLITTAEELAGLAARVNNKEQKEDFAGQYFKLTNDIYLTDFTNPDTASWHEWTPIGAWTDDQKGPYEHYFDTCYFRGHFDGGNHTIHNIYMGTVGEIYIPDADDPLGSDIIDLTGSCQGFFGFVDQATIKNLNLQNAGITAANYYNGALISNAYNSTITNCHVRKSTVVAAVASEVGGLIGLLKSSIVDSCSVEDIQVKGSYVGGLISYVDSASVVRNSHATGKAFVIKRTESGNYGGFGGGLAQHNAGLIENCYTDMEMQAIFAENIAGFVASTAQNSIIRNCYAKGNVYGGQDCAGFVARNYGLIESCYSTGNVIIPGEYGHYPATFVTQVGLFTMYNGYVEANMPGTCINCFSTGCCISTESGSPAYITYGFLYGVQSDDSRVINCSFNKDSIAYYDKFTLRTTGTRGYNKAQMQSQAFVDALNMVAALYGLSTWEYRAGDYPVPTGVKANITDYLAGGSGTEGDPYLIETKKHLENFRDYVNLGETFKGKYIRQTADIALNAPRSQWGVQMPKQWTPIGTMTFSPFHKEQTTEEKALWYTHYFRGTYDGDFHKVENMYIDDPVGRPAGLFGVLSHDAVIKNLSVTDAYVVSPGTLSGVAILASDVDRYARNVYISQCHTSGVVGDPDNLFWLGAASAIVNGIALEGDNWILNCSSSADVYAAEMPSAVTHQGGIGGTDTIGNFLFTGTLTKRCNMSYCVLMVPNVQDAWIKSQNGYFDSDKFQWSTNAQSTYNNLGRPTAYLQSAEFANVLNDYVDNWNATHAFKLDYWQLQEGDYPRVNPDYKPTLTVTFESNGGSSVATKNVSENTHVLMPEKPIKEGYIFAGWYADAAFTQVFDFDSTAVTQSMILYAKWLEPTYDEYDYSIFNNKFATEFHITNKAQFIGFMHAVNGIDGVLTPNNFKGKTVYLDCDILLNDTADWQYWGKYTYAESWTPIGTGSYYMDPVHPFLGIFDGQGHVISGLYIDAEENFKAIANHYEDGLFGYVGTKGEATEIRNLGVQASVADMRVYTLNVQTEAGLLVGVLRDGTISQCFTHGKIIVNAKSNEDIGGFAGQLGGINYDAGGAITDCYARVDIIYNPMDINATVRGLFGSGLVDWNNGSISNSYVAGGSWQEGVAGGTISNVYYNKELSPNTGAVATGSGTTVTNIYYDKQVNGKEKGAGEGKTTNEMHAKSTFVGFDFETIWGRNDTINDGYPYLRCFYESSIPDSSDPIMVTGIEMEETVLNVIAGEQVQLHANVLPIDAQEKGIYWTITNTYTDVAEVDESGLVTTHFLQSRAGYTTTSYITATTVEGNFQKRCTLNVYHPSISVVAQKYFRRIDASDWIYIASTSMNYVGWQTLVTISINPDSLHQAVTFENSNPEVAQFEIISQDTTYDGKRCALGTLTCYTKGSTTLTVRHPNGYISSRTFNVYQYDLKGISINAPSTTMNVGDTMQLTINTTPIYASILPEGYTWSSSDESVLYVDHTGKLIAKKAGTVTITLNSTNPSYTATTLITVAAINPTSISIIPENITIGVGETYQLATSILPENASKDVTWSIYYEWESYIASVSNAGVVTGHAEGYVTVVATTINGLKAYCSVKVITKVTGVTLDKTSLVIQPGSTKSITATIQPNNATNKELVWSTTNENVAKIKVSGTNCQITAGNSGEAMVIVSTREGGFSDTCHITVSVPTYSVTFQDWDGTILKTEQVEQGKSATAPANPSRDGYTFTGWDKDFTNVQSDLTVTAQYTKNIVYYTVTFLDWDGTKLYVEQVEEGKDAVGPTSNPTRDGYTFIGWSKPITNITSNLTVIAQYEQNKIYYTVTFLDWDGTELHVEQVEEGKDAVGPTSNPTRDGYTFIGWSKPITNITSNLTVIAQYEQNKIYYTVTFLDWDGTELHVEQVEEGKDAVGPTSNPTREGYIFIGWSKPITNITSNLTVIAQYEQNKIYYAVTFLDWDGTILKTEQVLQGQSATPPADPIREGYTFIGWDTDFSNVQSDLLVRALYEQNTAIDDIEEESTLRPRKEMIDGILYIIMPDGTKYTITGVLVK